jgi:acetoin utilization deacetylase AcuC-like enzyme
MSKRGKSPTPSSDSPFPSTARRIWNQIVVGLNRRATDFVYSTEYQVDLGTKPIDSLRAQRIITYLLSQSMIGPKVVFRPEPASLKDLELAHSREYLETLRKASALEEVVGVEVWPDLHDQILRAQRSSVGGTILATRRALASRGIAVNLGGGLHHATRSSGRGFCVFNDVAVAILKARESGYEHPVLVVDLDLHDGNGTREIFAEDDSVFTFSIHNQDWSRQPARASLSIELTGEVDDATYLEALTRHLPALIEDFRPGLVFYLAGTDPAMDDQIGNWKISPEGMLRRDRFVVGQIRGTSARGTPMVVLLAGGYGSETWRYSARFFSWLLTNSIGKEPPSTADMTLARYRSLARELVEQDLNNGSSSNDWGLTEADITGGLGPEASRSRFLDHYSHHALELALEWTGVLDRLRSLGFHHPYLDLDLTNPSGHTLRLFADSTKQELLVEVRLRIERNIIPNAELLSIEWLLMQNPKAQFSSDRPRLPQQTHPGLGLASDAIPLMILICDRLKLDGIVFVPSHYHLALKVRKHLHFLTLDDRNWFHAVEKAVEGIPLTQATAIVARGDLRDRSSGESVDWRPMPMVLAVSDQLKKRIELEKASVETARPESSFDFEVASDITPQ